MLLVFELLGGLSQAKCMRDFFLACHVPKVEPRSHSTQINLKKESRGLTRPHETEDLMASP